MAKSLAVKIPTASLIAEVETQIAKLEQDIEQYADKRKQYEADLKKWQRNIIDHAIKALQDPSNIGTDSDSLISVSYNNYRSGVGVEFDSEALGFPKRPEEPTRPNQQSYYGRDYTTKLDLLKKNLKVLKMTNQEEVNASTYNSVMELL
jgi:septal ring factor EnvC (AmiA/AmiB activator)